MGCGSGGKEAVAGRAAETGLPVIHLDVHFWKPGWVEPSEEEWREKQRGLLTSDEWIVDGNYHATLDVRLERADTVVFLDTPWWVCARRGFVRGIRKRPVGFQLPNAPSAGYEPACECPVCRAAISMVTGHEQRDPRAGRPGRESNPVHLRSQGRADIQSQGATEEGSWMT